MANFFKTKKARGVLNVIFSVGAAVVIFGALAKIEHWGGAWGSALTIGMLTETFVFLLMALQPAEEEYHWEKYYPYLNLSPEEEKRITGKYQQRSVATGAAQVASPLSGMDQMLEQADITPANLKKLSDNFQRLDQTISQISDISGTVAATGAFTRQTNEAAKAMEEITEVYTRAAKSMEGFNEAASNSEEFHSQLQAMTKNLGSLNTIYELELQDTNNHLKAMNKFYENMTQASEAMAGSVEDSQKTQQQISLLAQNLESLNAIYGNMLSAMHR